MSEETRSLWPTDLLETPVDTPVQALREQAALLGKMTKNVLRADVISENVEEVPKGGLKVRLERPLFKHTFMIESPTLEFTYQLFDVYQGSAGYPVVLEFFTETKYAKDRAELLEVLEGILQSEKTKRILQSILSITRK